MIQLKNFEIKLLIIITAIFGACQSNQTKVTKYSNGYVFNGVDFNKASFVVKHGELDFSTSAKFNTEVDLTGKYVIPAFGDAHTHNFDDVAKFDSIYKAYIDEGTFYVQGGIGDPDLEALQISDSILDLAGKNGAVITPTVSFAKYYANQWDGSKMSLDTLLLQKKNEFLKKQLIRYREANIVIVLGADQGFSTLREEINDVKQIDAFSNLELLNILTQTPKIIFPNRKIGALKNGYEATFLVLNNNPLIDMNNIENIEMRVKNGITLK